MVEMQLSQVVLCRVIGVTEAEHELVPSAFLTRVSFLWRCFCVWMASAALGPLGKPLLSPHPSHFTRSSRL